jgi:pyridoxal phosphate enzyme (YggS family)
MYRYLKNNIERVKETVSRAALKAGRKPEEIIIVAVSKNFSPEVIRAAYERGLNNFGESRVQEAEPKIKALDFPARWHLIGHLQKNKAKKAVGLFDMIQSVDSIELAKALDRHSLEFGKKIPCLIEVNSTGEISKYGVPPGGTLRLVEELAAFKNIELSGLMTIGPLTDNERFIRKAFQLTENLFENGKKIAGKSFQYLSMGMSGDYEIAIEEGSNMIRIGTAIFGER